MVQIYDNFLETEDLDFLENYLLYECLHKYGQYSELEDHFNPLLNAFYATYFDAEDTFIMSILNKIIIRTDTQLQSIHRIHSNIQYHGMDTSYHHDYSNNTFLLMVRGEPSCGFEYLDENSNSQVIEFVPNRLIHFNGKKIKHRGLAPKEIAPRVTLAFKADN